MLGGKNCQRMIPQTQTGCKGKEHLFSKIPCMQGSPHPGMETPSELADPAFTVRGIAGRSVCPFTLID